MEIPGWNQFVGLIEGVLVYLANFTGNSGWAIVILTIIIKLLLVPLTLSSLRSAKRMQELQPLLKDLQRKYGEDRQMLSVETMKLYQEHKVNPFGSCLPILLQMPIFFGLYYAILNLSQHPQPGVSTSFAWIPNLAENDPFHLLPVIVTVTQFLQQRMAMPQQAPGQQAESQQQMQNQMLSFMPLMVGVFAWNVAAGPVLYWITQTVFSAVQQYFITGFGSLRTLPGLGFLPVPPWAAATASPSQARLGSVAKSRPVGQPPAQVSGQVGRFSQQSNARLEEVERQRGENASAAGMEGEPGGRGVNIQPSQAGLPNEKPAQRSSRCTPPKRSRQ